MATVGPPGAFRRITVHYSTTGDDANHDDFLEYVIGDVLQHQEGLHQSYMGTRTPGASWCMHCCHGESSKGTAAETSGTSDEQIATDLEYAMMLQEMEDLDVDTPPNDDEEDDIGCVPSPSDTDDDDDHGDQEEAVRQDDDDNDTDDDVDLDNMTYEQRQELVESVGNESRGLSDELMSYLVPWKYKSGSGFFSKKTNHDETCTVCLSAFKNKENIITLPCPVCKYEVFGPS